MPESVTYDQFLGTLSYPIFVDGLRFTEKQLRRNRPNWLWSSVRKKAFFNGKSRLFSIWRFSSTLEYEDLPLYQKWFKVRDFLNTGKLEDYPVNDEVISRQRASTVMRNLILGRNIKVSR